MPFVNPLITAIRTAFRSKGTLEHTQRGPTRAAETRAVLEAMVTTGPNFRPDLLKAVGVKTHTPATLAAGYMSLDELKEMPELLCLQTRIRVELPPAGESGEYVVVYDPASTMNVWREATFRGETVPASIVPVESPQAIGASVPEFDPFDPLGYDGPDANGRGAAVVRRTVNFVVLFYSALQGMAPDDFPEGFPVPGTPGGAAYWREASPPNPVYRAFEQIKHAVLLFQADDSDYISAGRIYAITDRPNGAQTVYAEFDTTESRVCEKARVAGLPGLFRYELTTDTLTQLESGITQQQAVQAVRASGEFESRLNKRCVLVNAQGTRTVFTDLRDASNSMQAGDTLEVYGQHDYSSVAYIACGIGTLYLAPGAVLKAQQMYAPNNSFFDCRLAVAGSGTLELKMSVGPACRAFELGAGVTLKGQLNIYAYNETAAFTRLITVRGTIQSGADIPVLVTYGHGGFYHSYVAVELYQARLVTTAASVVKFVDGVSGNAANAGAEAANRLRLVGCTITAPAAAKVVDDSSGVFTFEQGQNYYVTCQPPTKTAATTLMIAPSATAGPPVPASTRVLVTGVYRQPAGDYLSGQDLAGSGAPNYEAARITLTQTNGPASWWDAATSEIIIQKAGIYTFKVSANPFDGDGNGYYSPNHTDPGLSYSPEILIRNAQGVKLYNTINWGTSQPGRNSGQYHEEEYHCQVGYRVSAVWYSDVSMRVVAAYLGAILVIED